VETAVLYQTYKTNIKLKITLFTPTWAPQIYPTTSVSRYPVYTTPSYMEYDRPQNRPTQIRPNQVDKR
jgi:hypothetical protein